MMIWTKLWITSILFMVSLESITVHGACYRKGFNQRSPGDVIETFDKLVDESFVGQDQAVRVVRRELVEFINMEHDEPLLLHFVGPTGTGKSFLAELVAKSLFQPVDCRPESKLEAKIGDWKTVGAGTVATAVFTTVAMFSNPVMPVIGLLSAGAGLAATSKTTLEYTCALPSPLASWEQMCGVSEGRFKPFISEDLSQATMQSILANAAEELRHQPSSVVILDEFQYCAGRQCERLLHDVLGRKTLLTAAGDPVSSRDAIFVLTSDLSEFGVELLPGSSYDEALEQVLAAAAGHWGAASPVLTAPVVVPFAPLSHGELVRIVDKMVERFKGQVANRVAAAVAEKQTDAAGARWTGKVYCGEGVKEAVVDRLHEQARVKNARAITEDLRSVLKMALRHPVPIEDRIMGEGPKAGKGNEWFYDASVELSVGTDAGAKWLQLEVVS